MYAKLIGITPEYSTGDKVIAWSYFGYSIVYRFGLTFVVTVIWNLISPWPLAYWGWYFLIVFLIVPGINAFICTFWFPIGGIIDMRQLFRDLDARAADDLDNGVVEGNMSLSDKAKFEALEKQEKSESKSEEK